MGECRRDDTCYNKGKTTLKSYTAIVEAMLGVFSLPAAVSWPVYYAYILLQTVNWISQLREAVDTALPTNCNQLPSTLQKHNRLQHASEVLVRVVCSCQLSLTAAVNPFEWHMDNKNV